MKSLIAKEIVKRSKVIAMVRGNFTKQEIIETVKILAVNKITTIELTLNTPNALESISEIRNKFPQVLIGTGTVRTKQNLLDSMNAGAQFTLAPNLCRDSAELALKNDFLHLPGILTPTEAQTAANLGLTMLKLFPTEFGGANYLKAIRAPLDDLDFVPTGGITAENVNDFFNAGAAAVGIGSSLVSKKFNAEDLNIKASLIAKSVGL